jgi:hypothetical protein
VRVCVPLARVLVEQLAVPFARLRFAHPVTGLAPSFTVTAPLGVPAALVTETVKVTASPACEGLDEELSAVVVAAFTTCATVLEVPAT